MGQVGRREGVWWAISAASLIVTLRLVWGEFDLLAWSQLAGGTLLVLLLWGSSCAGWGGLVCEALFRAPALGAAVQLTLGLATVLLLDWSLAWAGLLHRATAMAVLLLGVALLLQQVWQQRRREVRMPTPTWPMVFIAPALGVLLLMANCAPGTLWGVEAFGYDVLTYHLQLPREWVELGRMAGLRHNVYSYLPNLAEAGYMQAMLVRGSAVGAVYWASALHAGAALLAAASIASLVSHIGSRVAGAVAAAVFLLTPWTLITGSLAYNEMAVLAFAAAAMRVAFDPFVERRRGAAMVGWLLGCATLAKPTAGPMLALPVVLVLLLGANHAVRWRRPTSWRRSLRSAAIAASVGLLTLGPYFIRNWAWAGNPVFPFAASVLGQAHWSDEQVARWDAAHKPALSSVGVLRELLRQGPFNAGYGAVGGFRVGQVGRDIARFPREFGVPLLALGVAGAALATWRWPMTRRPARGCLLLLLLQGIFWVFATHHQSRFLVPSLLPAAVLAGLGVARMERSPRSIFAQLVLACALVTMLAHLVLLLPSQSRLSVSQLAGLPVEDQPGQPSPLRRHPINALPSGSKVMLVGDVSGLLYLWPSIVYAGAFDRDPMGEALRRVGPVASAVTDELTRQGVTHVWVGWSELDRLHATYGYDERVTRQSVSHLAQQGGWRTLFDAEIGTLLELRPR